MTGTPPVLPETPGAPSDALSDLLDTMHLSGMVLFRAEFTEPWSVMAPDAAQLARVLPFRTEHIIPFHVVAAGGCRVELPQREPLWLSEGDAVIIPYGDSHCLSGSEAAATVPVGQLLPAPPWRDAVVVAHGGGGAQTSLVCGFLHCDDLLFRPILRHLPVLLQASPGAAAEDHWLASTIRRTAAEASKPLPGSRSMLPRLTELMFVEILRKHMQGLSSGEVGWFAAYRDAVAGPALRALHAAPLADWTVEELARQVGASRTVLAERFKHFLDQPPMQYLANWRLRRAAQALDATDLPIKAIAERGGYDSEAAFSRAFRRHFGLPPGDWRRRRDGRA